MRSGLTLQQYRERAVSEAQLRRLVSRGEEEIRATLEAWGHHGCSIRNRLEPTPAGGFEVTYEVDAGEPTLVRRSAVTVSGEAALDCPPSPR